MNIHMNITFAHISHIWTVCFDTGTKRYITWREIRLILHRNNANIKWVPSPTPRISSTSPYFLQPSITACMELNWGDLTIMSVSDLSPVAYKNHPIVFIYSFKVLNAPILNPRLRSQNLFRIKKKQQDTLNALSIVHIKISNTIHQSIKQVFVLLASPMKYPISLPSTSSLPRLGDTDEFSNSLVTLQNVK